MDPHAEHPYPPHSRSIYQLSTSLTASRSPACSPSHHIFPAFDSTITPSSFLTPSPTTKLAGSLTHSACTAFTFPPSSLLPPCPLSPAHSLFDGPAPSSSSSSSSAASYSRPSSPIPADPYIASILSSPSEEYSFPPMLPSTSMMSDELSEVLSEVGDIGCVVFSSPSSPSCTSPWSNGFEVSGGDCDSGSGSGGSDSEGRGEGAASDESTTMTGERDSQPTTDDDDSYTAASPSSPLPPVESTPKRRRKLTAKQQQQQLTPKPAPTEKGRKRRLTATAAPQYDEAEVPEDKRERNKQSASDYRKRRKLYVASLEQQLNELKAALRVEREEGKKLRGENTVLRASMQMMREFVQGNKNNTTTPAMTATARTEEKEEEDDEEEAEAEEAEIEAARRWETAVSVRVPEEYRPIAPSQKVEQRVEEGATTHTHNTRKRRGRQGTTTAVGKQHKVGLTLFVLFSCFLLYFPWLSELSSSPLMQTASVAPSTDVLAGEKLTDASLFYNTPPDCIAQPDVCNRGRTILKLMDGDIDVDVHMFLDEQHYTSTPAVLEAEPHSVKLEPSQTAVGVKMDAYEEAVMEQLLDVAMSPLSLPMSAHNASAALVWLSEHADDSIELLMMQAADPWASHNDYDDGGWAAAGDSGSASHAV